MEHFFRSIPGWYVHADLYRGVVQHAAPGAHFVEVGAWKGKSASFMAVEIINSGKTIQFDVVDTWDGRGEDGEYDEDVTVKHGKVYDAFMYYTEPVKDYIKPVRMTSVDAAKLYADNSLDFVFLDAGHEYEDVKADIAAWWPKLKPGGTMGGDDYTRDGVKFAVNEAFPYHNLIVNYGIPTWNVQKG